MAVEESVLTTRRILSLVGNRKIPSLESVLSLIAALESVRGIELLKEMGEI